MHANSASKFVILTVLANWYQKYLSGYAAPQGQLTFPTSCSAPRGSPPVSSASWVWSTINMGICIREGTKLLGFQFPGVCCWKMEKQIAVKLQDYLLGQHGRENHLKQMIQQGTVTNWTVKHTNFNFYKNRNESKG